jgi:hypothetical protein
MTTLNLDKRPAVLPMSEAERFLTVGVNLETGRLDLRAVAALGHQMGPFKRVPGSALKRGTFVAIAYESNCAGCFGQIKISDQLNFDQSRRQERHFNTALKKPCHGVSNPK